MNFIESIRIKIIIHTYHICTCLAMQCPAVQSLLFCIQNVHVVHKIAQTKRTRTKQLHEMAGKKLERYLVFSRGVLCYLKSHLFYMWATNCWWEFYLELGFHFMAFYILLSHIISNTLLEKNALSLCPRVCVCVCVWVWRWVFSSSISDRIKSCWSDEFLDWKC